MPGGEPDRDAADRLGHVAEVRRQLVVALDRDRRAREGRERAVEVGEGDQRVERAGLRARRQGRLAAPPRRARRSCGRGPGPRTAGVDAATEITASSGIARITSSTSSTSALASANPRAPVDALAEPLAAGGIARGDGAHRPARAVERDAQRRAHGAGAHDPDDRPLRPGRCARAGGRGRFACLGRLTSPWRWCPGAGGSSATPSASRSRSVSSWSASRRSAARLRQVVGLVPGPHRDGTAAGRPCSRYASMRRV